VHKTCDKVLENWHQRRHLAEMVRADYLLMNRDRNIYYDTDNIHEHQQETIRVCDSCGGALKIDSAARGGNISWRCTSRATPARSCRKQGYQWYDSADTTRYDKIYLQDRSGDVIKEKQRYQSHGDLGPDEQFPLRISLS
jgi:phage terminase large subunit